MKKLSFALIALGFVFASFTAVAAWAPDASDKLELSVAKAIIDAKQQDPSLANWFDTAYAYAVFPNVGKGGIGAWQLAMRFSSVDLNDKDITGGDAQNFSLGLNWFTTNNIRMSANYINVLDVNGGAGNGDEPEAFQMRAQVEF